MNNWPNPFIEQRADPFILRHLSHYYFIASVPEYDRLEIRRVLIIAPRKVAEATWQDEAAKWEHLRHLRISTVLGAAKQRLAALAGGSALTRPSQSVCSRTIEQFAGDESYVQGRDWQALLRLLDRIDPSYKD